MRIGKFLTLTMLDYPGVISAEIFTSGCDYRCPACHNPELLNESVDEKAVLDYLEKSKSNWIDGLVISGGEPTTQKDLVEFIRKVRNKGIRLVKLDTNGSNPEVIKELLEGKLVDYVAMDVKGPRELYADITATKNYGGIEESMNLVQRFPRHEFRTTIVPVIRSSADISFLTAEEVGNAAKWIGDSTGRNDHTYFLQRFSPRKSENGHKGLLDSRLESFPETSDKLMLDSLSSGLIYLPNAKVR